jgi:preprotein translocase subunit YajC
VPPELQFLVILIALVGFWAIVMRPARNQQRRTAELQAELAVGDEVIISAGIFATVVALEDDKVRLEIAPGTVITAARQVVVRRVSDPATDDATGPADDQDAVPDTSSTDATEEKHDRG